MNGIWIKDIEKYRYHQLANPPHIDWRYKTSLQYFWANLFIFLGTLFITCLVEQKSMHVHKQSNLTCTTTSYFLVSFFLGFSFLYVKSSDQDDLSLTLMHTTTLTTQYFPQATHAQFLTLPCLDFNIGFVYTILSSCGSIYYSILLS